MQNTAKANLFDQPESPTEADQLTVAALTAQIRGDAADGPEDYLRETIVPEGGE